MSSLPNLFLIGAMKAGTTSLASWLGLSDAVFVPKVKEPNYYSKELRDAGIIDAIPAGMLIDLDKVLDAKSDQSIAFSYVADEDFYHRLYAPASDKFRYRLDASTTYLNSPYAPSAIHKAHPDAKIMVVTRDPVRRAWSEFLMNVSIGVSDMNFERALEREVESVLNNRPPLLERYITTGLYEMNIGRYEALFPSEQILRLDFDDIASDFVSVSANISSFLGIDDLPNNLGVENASRMPRFKVLNNVLHTSGLKYWLRDRTPDFLRQPLLRAFYGPTKITMPEDFVRCYKVAHDRIYMHLSTSHIWSTDSIAMRGAS
ncbi:sulfotransferase [Novosphingobium malaysiense]|uniref:Sulfotransferase domain-containing protein n=1 Tax=Novosphingobium malaysiense TaxID=1348853 RepID=A0A0B1ZHN8_9SPHN|nr:sulfotransferase [Novosphingobium malaysiense]KHK90017.1 hypothetical protein LK12_19230 [Novosphingobium malaysiense]